MKSFFLISVFSILLFSQTGTYLYVKNTRCVYDLVPNNVGNGFCYKYSDHPNVQRCSTRAKITDYVAGYDYNASTDRCELEHDLQITGMRKEDYTRVMAYLAIAFSFVFVFSLSILL